LIKWATWAALAGSMVLAIVAGCGGSKSGGTSENSSASSTPGGQTPAPSPPPAAESTASPATSTPPVAAADLGARVFATRCALCHGPDGHGDGVGSKGLKPQPRNFHDQAYMSTRTDAQLLATIHSGKGPMPRWQGVLSEAEMAAALKHIRELGKKP
jgi:mono/diheme cytochrome c family protein